ncbi:MmcQ/YjbR family DNA-binding protein [Algicola sagamiensis]|uniref:MmcQ/YjbR family DNA-binding protein n=1 Tax=Algicola sagamiensis TaxID=163869 RepID=UPI000375F4B0|nr:MmcQ/YjbR family DNA-binding protein [Algicola sagamiensis]
MDFETLRAYLLKKPKSAENFPFGDDVHVFKVHEKMFALISWRDNKMMMNLKCDPDEAHALRDIFPAITPAYHMNKRHWISVYFDGTVPYGELERLMDNSYSLVIKTLPKYKRILLTD